MTTLLDGARALALDIDEAQLAKLVAHLDLLDEWSTRMNLTAIRERDQQITKHLLDSLSVRPFLRGERIADVGSGAGFPGIPLAIVEPGRHFTLIESTGKKCRFLEHVLGDLLVALTDGREVHARAPLVEQVQVGDELGELGFVGVEPEGAGPVEERGHQNASAGTRTQPSIRIRALRLMMALVTVHSPSTWRASAPTRSVPEG